MLFNSQQLQTRRSFTNFPRKDTIVNWHWVMKNFLFIIWLLQLINRIPSKKNYEKSIYKQELTYNIFPQLNYFFVRDCHCKQKTEYISRESEKVQVKSAWATLTKVCFYGMDLLHVSERLMLTKLCFCNIKWEILT